MSTWPAIKVVDGADMATEIRSLLSDLGIAQRSAAGMLGVPERQFRAWCSGESAPKAVVFALRQLVKAQRGMDAGRANGCP